jgi:hypothetical protein
MDLQRLNRGVQNNRIVGPLHAPLHNNNSGSIPYIMWGNMPTRIYR